MKNLMSLGIALGIAGLAFTGTAFGAEEKKESTPQQQRMAECNKTAGEKGLKGDDRKQFMSNCLSGKPDAKPAAASTQQEKMKACNAEAGKKSLKGDERKKFMSGCLSG
jgi:hypothetical protein